jgi:excisionase family DNA binding protein
MTEQSETPELVTIEDAAKVIKVDPQTILDLIADGKLKSVQVGNIPMVSRLDLERLDPDDYMGLTLVP